MASQSPKGSRNYLKCQECRLKKRKCEPENRNWDELGEKCRSCLNSGAPCGPNVFYSSRDHQPSSVSSTLNVPSFAPSSSSHNVAGHDGSYLGSSATRGAAASPSFHRVTQERPHGRTRAPSVFDTGSEARPLGTKDIIRARLIDLGNLSDLYCYLEGRQNAALIAQPPRQTQEYEDVYNLVTTVMDYARSKYASICDYVLDMLLHIVRTEKELFLRTLVDKISYFTSMSVPLQTMTENGGDDHGEIKTVHCRALSQLAAVCEEAGDHSDAFRFKRQLDTFTRHYNIVSDEVQPIYAPRAFTEMSTRISDAFRSLKIPNRYARLLPKTDNMFPALHLAVHAGQPLTAHSILADGLYNTADRDILSRQALHIAAETGDLWLLQLALEGQDELQTDIDVFKMTALCIATYTRNENVVSSLIGSGSDESVVALTGRSVLCIAAGKGHLAIVRYLLDRGHRPNATKNFGPSGNHSALHAAAAGGHPATAEVLVQYGASALFLSNGLTPADEAELHGHNALAKRLREIEAEQKAALPQQFENPEITMQRALMSTINSNQFMPQFTESPGSFVPHPLVAPAEAAVMSASLSLSSAESNHPPSLLLARSLSSSPSGSIQPRKRARHASHHPVSRQMSPALSDLSSKTSSTSRVSTGRAHGSRSSASRRDDKQPSRLHSPQVPHEPSPGLLSRPAPHNL